MPRRVGVCRPVTIDSARTPLRARTVRHQARARQHPRDSRGARQPGAHLPIDSHRRHQRQGLGGGHGRARAACGRAEDRTLHVAASRSHRRARGARRPDRRSRDLRRRHGRRARVPSMPCMATGSLPVPPTFFEVSTAVAFEIFKRAAVDVGDRRSRPGRPFRCDQRPDADDHRDHDDRASITSVISATRSSRSRSRKPASPSRACRW